MSTSFKLDLLRRLRRVLGRAPAQREPDHREATPDAANITEIYKSAGYRATAAIHDESKPIVICFEGWRQPATLEGSAFGFEFLQSRRRNAIEIKCAKNDWYQNTETETMLTAVDRFAARRVRTGYGSSMGGYAAINFSRHLRFSKCLVFSPQYSVDPRKVPFEHRFDGDVRNIERFVCDGIDGIPPVEVAAFYDPRHDNDRRHIELIRKHHVMVDLRLPFAGHTTAEYLMLSGMLTDLALRLLEAPISLPEVFRSRRSSRADLKPYWVNMSTVLASRGKLSSALAAAERGLAARIGNAVLARHHYAEMLYLSGTEQEALAIWVEQLADPAIVAVQDFLVRDAAARWRWDRVLDQLSLPH